MSEGAVVQSISERSIQQSLRWVSDMAVLTGTVVAITIGVVFVMYAWPWR